MTATIILIVLRYSDNYIYYVCVIIISYMFMVCYYDTLCVGVSYVFIYFMVCFCDTMY